MEAGWGLHGLGRPSWGPPGSAGEGGTRLVGREGETQLPDRARPPRWPQDTAGLPESSGQVLDACLGPHTLGSGGWGVSLQGCLRKKHRTVRDQAPGLGGPWSRSWKGLQPRLSPQVLTLRRTPTSQGVARTPVPEGGLLLRSTQGPTGSRGASAHLTPTPRPRAAGAGRRLEAEPPGVSGDHEAAPEAGGGPCSHNKEEEKGGGGRKARSQRSTCSAK